ncbi:MAG: triose-phosphate isomerase [Candidatus Peribacteraceae bacterium]
MKRKKFIGANLKMNPLPKELDAYRSTDDAEVVLFPAAIDLRACIDTGVNVGAQAARPEEKGAFTGDLSTQMLKEIGVSHVLCGHSERRMHHQESDAFVALQVKSAIDTGLTAVLCIGETEQEKESGKTKEVLERQLAAVTTHYPLATRHFVIAYEPVWAIGTGKTPTAEEIQQTHTFIRSLLSDKNIRILYGGSVKASNAKDIFGCPDVDGALVGGASLDPTEFKAIVKAAQ